MAVKGKQQHQQTEDLEGKALKGTKCFADLLCHLRSDLLCHRLETAPLPTPAHLSVKQPWNTPRAQPHRFLSAIESTIMSRTKDRAYLRAEDYKFLRTALTNVVNEETDRLDREDREVGAVVLALWSFVFLTCTPETPESFRVHG